MYENELDRQMELWARAWRAWQRAKREQEAGHQNLGVVETLKMRVQQEKSKYHRLSDEKRNVVHKMTTRIPIRCCVCDKDIAWDEWYVHASHHWEQFYKEHEISLAQQEEVINDKELAMMKETLEHFGSHEFHENLEREGAYHPECHVAHEEWKRRNRKE